MKLNKKKCTFGVLSRKSLGYLVFERAIEANLAKIKAIQEIAEPKTVKEVQKLAGRMASSGRFLSRAGDLDVPLYKILRRPSTFEWTNDTCKAFQSLNHISLLLLH